MRDIGTKQLASEINESMNDPRCIYQIVGNAMYLNDNKPFPPERVGIGQPEELINYYHDKIKEDIYIRIPIV